MDAVVPSLLCSQESPASCWELGTGVQGSALSTKASTSQAQRGKLNPGQGGSGLVWFREYEGAREGEGQRGRNLLEIEVSSHKPSDP